ncbi:alpha/beta hydrolase [Streptomyces scopuliridis]|uniref:Alpha/beta hydrolase n=1 Tax=Streptomyces scopuliridis TaxID=452529 RepID=A0ACD4ZHA9_9ACTN|nr:alpha/beta hydrolase [Streptomyces scopuliridis]WSB97835.1 alpha/beta hydrolase [Streptomyces scopuliridis]WSC08462.1 alpha/beta hydrolase [Streptomyces scopuliridis]
MSHSPSSALSVRRAPALAAVTAVALLAATGCSGDSGASSPGSSHGGNTRSTDRPKDLATQRLQWKACKAPSVAEGGGTAPSPLPGGARWECSFMKAPLDYAKPDGDTIDLALIRAKARDTKQRIGSLIFNFGGPGGSGITGLPSFAQDYEKLRARYDLVSFDPRGVGDSDGVKCESDRQLDAYFAKDSTPDTPAEVQTFTNGLAGFAAACEKNSGSSLPYVGTTNAARDMELMRKVLGDSKLYYFGISYGTELGGVYAHLYPKSVGRAVFDAVVDPTQNSEQGSLGQAKGFQLALDNFEKDCIARGDACALPGTTPKEIEGFITKLLARLDKRPIAGIGDRKLTQTQATNGIAQALYSKDFWPYLEQGLDEADGGNGALLLALSDSMNGRDQYGRYSNLQAANVAINCVDSKERYTVAQTEAKLPEFRKASPVFGEFLGWGLMSCTKWPVPGKWSTPDVSATGSAPILIVGNTGDPATPYAGARAMADALGKGVGTEITYHGQGHGSYDSGNPCVQGAVNGYLLNGKVPPAGTVCR